MKQSSYLQQPIPPPPQLDPHLRSIWSTLRLNLKASGISTPSSNKPKKDNPEAGYPKSNYYLYYEQSMPRAEESGPRIFTDTVKYSSTEAKYPSRDTAAKYSPTETVKQLPKDTLRYHPPDSAKYAPKYDDQSETYRKQQKFSTSSTSNYGSSEAKNVKASQVLPCRYDPVPKAYQVIMKYNLGQHNTCRVAQERKQSIQRKKRPLCEKCGRLIEKSYLPCQVCGFRPGLTKQFQSPRLDHQKRKSLERLTRY